MDGIGYFSRFEIDGIERAIIFLLVLVTVCENCVRNISPPIIYSVNSVAIAPAGRAFRIMA